MSSQGISFSLELAKQRQQKLIAVLGVDIVKRIVGVALFVLGAKRRDIARIMGWSAESLKTFLRRLHAGGLPALQDRRKKAITGPITPVCASQNISLRNGDSELILDFAQAGSTAISHNNPLQIRTIVLTLLTGDIITTAQAASFLNLSQQRVRQLAALLAEGDVTALEDRRCGQKQDYRMTGEIKTELIQQLAAHAMTNKPTSGAAIATAVNERLGLKLAARTVRECLRKLGLGNLPKTLPSLVDDLKKSS